MIINKWRKYPKQKPKKYGKYLCKVLYGSELEHNEVVILTFDTIDGGKWIDENRQSVFDGYKVYISGKVPMESNRVFTDGLCKRDFVVAWKKLPKAWKVK